MSEAAWNSAPVPSEARVIANLRQSNEKLREALIAAQGERKRKQFTRFCQGSVFGFVLAVGAFVASAAWAETIQIGRAYIHGEAFGSTTVTIAPSDVQGQLATVTLDNRHVNQGSGDGTYPLAMGDVLTVEIQYLWDADPVLGSDRITVIVPPGITCDPEDCGVTVMEGFTGTVTLYDWRGM